MVIICNKMAGYEEVKIDKNRRSRGGRGKLDKKERTFMHLLGVKVEEKKSGKLKLKCTSDETEVNEKQLLNIITIITI